MLTGGTDVHLVLVDLRHSDLDGQQAEDLLHAAGITVNRNAVPFDPRPPRVTSGLRIGTPALATRGFGDVEFTEVADIIANALINGAATDVDGAQGPGAQAHRRLPAVLRPAAVLMTAQLLDGTATAARIKAELTERVVALAARGVAPGLGTLLVGDDPGSRWYVAGKHKDCAEVGIASIREDLPATATQDEIEAAVRRLNEDPECTGFIVQLPLPKGIDTNRVLELVDPDKDADGLHPTNLGRLVLRVNEPVTSPLPCTPRGIIDLLLRHDIDLHGADVVVVGRGVTVGRSIGLLLTRREINATVTLTHTGTEDLAEHTRNADVIIAAAGVPGIITADIVKPGAVVIDVGVSRSTDPETGKSRVVGDVDPGVREVASWVSPNPGGVGPMTRAMLLSNVVDTAERLLG